MDTNENVKTLLKKLSDRRKSNKIKMDIHIYTPLIGLVSKGGKNTCFLSEKHIIGVDKRNDSEKKLYIVEYIPFSKHLYYSYQVKKKNLLEALESGDFKDIMPSKKMKTKIEFIEYLPPKTEDSFYKNEYKPLGSYSVDMEDFSILNNINSKLNEINEERLLDFYKEYSAPIKNGDIQIKLPKPCLFFETMDEFLKKCTSFNSENFFFLGDYKRNNYSENTVKAIHNEKLKSLITFIKNWL